MENFFKKIDFIRKNVSFSNKVFCPTFFQKSWQGAECPADIRFAPTEAKRRLDRVHKKNLIYQLSEIGLQVFSLSVLH